MSFQEAVDEFSDSGHKKKLDFYRDWLSMPLNMLYWGPQVQFAISNETKSIIFKTLKELQPYHWTDTYYA